MNCLIPSLRAPACLWPGIGCDSLRPNSGGAEIKTIGRRELRAEKCGMALSGVKNESISGKLHDFFAPQNIAAFILDTQGRLT